MKEGLALTIQIHTLSLLLFSVGYDDAFFKRY